MFLSIHSLNRSNSFSFSDFSLVPILLFSLLSLLSLLFGSACVCVAFALRAVKSSNHHNLR